MKVQEAYLRQKSLCVRALICYVDGVKILLVILLYLYLVAYTQGARAQGEDAKKQIKGRTAAQVDVYLKELESTSTQSQLEALANLRELGARAKQALPSLYEFRRSPRCAGNQVQEATIRAIAEIERAVSASAVPLADRFPPGVRKPAVYLYPEQESEVSLQIFNRGPITAAWPPLGPGNTWKVRARPDGEITDDTGRTYRYLFWEGETASELTFDRRVGFVLSGGKVQEFLAKSLKDLGLTNDEANDFIVFWYPILSQHKFVYVHFLTEEYERRVGLKVTPNPDSKLRFFMLYQPLVKEISIIEQKLPRFQRAGFVLVDWGGGELANDGLRRLQ